MFAAHCVIGKGRIEWIDLESSFFVFENNHAFGDKAKIADFIIHPDWNPQDSHFRADIAIAGLKKPIKFSTKVHHVCLNSNPIQNFVGQNGSVSGWGYTENFERLARLRHVSIQLVDQSLCNSSDPSFPMYNSDTSFCAGARDGKTGPCTGNNILFLSDCSKRSPFVFGFFFYFIEVQKYIYWF